MRMGKLTFIRPRDGIGATSHLYVANCGPAVGLSLENISTAFGTFGTVTRVQTADESGSRVIVTYCEIAAAQAAKEAWDGYPCSNLGSRVLHIQYSVPQAPCQVEDTLPVFAVASEMGIPGLYLIHDFATKEEEDELLAAVDDRPWKGLLKRRVQHYGYEFMYKTRNVDTNLFLGQLPMFVLQMLKRISYLPELNQDELSMPFDQLTVNEYPAGVGLSPHIDTHSAFEGCILSLSLAGPCVMEFRKYTNGTWPCQQEMGNDITQEQTSNDFSDMKFSLDKRQQKIKQKPDFERKSIFLPPRSLLVLSEEARYAWHHYIPHHKVRFGPCHCQFQQYCDSQIQSSDSGKALEFKMVAENNGNNRKDLFSHKIEICQNSLSSRIAEDVLSSKCNMIIDENSEQEND